MNDLQRGDALLTDGHNFRDYINDYKNNAENAKLSTVVNALGLDVNMLTRLMNDNANEKNINNFGRFDALKNTVDKTKAKAYFEKVEGVVISPFKLNIRIDQFLQTYIFGRADDLVSDD